MSVTFARLHSDARSVRWVVVLSADKYAIRTADIDVRAFYFDRVRRANPWRSAVPGK